MSNGCLPLPRTRRSLVAFCHSLQSGFIGGLPTRRRTRRQCESTSRKKWDRKCDDKENSHVQNRGGQGASGGVSW